MSHRVAEIDVIYMSFGVGNVRVLKYILRGTVTLALSTLMQPCLRPSCQPSIAKICYDLRILRFFVCLYRNALGPLSRSLLHVRPHLSAFVRVQWQSADLQSTTYNLQSVKRYYAHPDH